MFVRRTKEEQQQHQQHFTSLGRVFGRDIWLINFCGGFLFNSPKYLNVAYKFTLIIISQLITTLMYKLFYDTRSAAVNRSQTLRLFRVLYFVVVCACMNIVTLFTCAKHHRLLYVLLNKRLHMSQLPESHSLMWTRAPVGLFMRSHSRVHQTRQILLANLLLAVCSGLLRDHMTMKHARLSYEKTVGQTMAGNATLVEGLQALIRERPAASQCVRVWLVFLNTWLDMIQMYGHFHVGLMITAGICDMIRCAREHDNLIAIRKETNKTFTVYHDDSLSTQRATTPQQQPMHCTQMLIQARDALISMRHAQSLDYLNLLVGDLVRLMTFFSWLCSSISVDSRKNLLTFVWILFEYVRLVVQTITTRVGYTWVHNEVYNLERVVEQRHLLARGELVASSSTQQQQQQQQLEVSKPEVITIKRLVDDIMRLWPTDWFTPDFRNYIKNTIIVVTLIATLEQLFETSERIDSHAGAKI